MDRRTFLKSSTAAAAIPAGAAVVASASTSPDRNSAATHTGAAHRWRAVRPADNLLADAAERLLNQISEATAGAITFDWGNAAAEPSSGIAAQHLHSGTIEVAFGPASDLLADPGLALFTGLPGPYALTPENLVAWHSLNGAGAHLDSVADSHGVKILLAGHTGAAPGLWADRDITDLRDAAETRMTSSGLGQVVWDRIRAAFPATTASEARAREFAADPACALRDARTEGLTHVFRDGLHNHGVALSLVVSAAAWDSLAPHLQTVIETTARAALSEAISIAAFHRQAVVPALTKAGTIVPRPLPEVVRKAIDHIALECIAEHITDDPRLASAWSAYKAFHRQVTGQTIDLPHRASYSA